MLISGLIDGRKSHPYRGAKGDGREGNPPAGKPALRSEFEMGDTYMNKRLSETEQVGAKKIEIRLCRFDGYIHGIRQVDRI